MKFDINSARSAGYSDDEIADYLATQNNFDLGGALKSGYSASEVIGFLSGDSAPAAPVTDTGDETARLAARFPAPERTASSLLPKPMDPLGIGRGKQSAPSEGRSATPMGRADPRLVEQPVPERTISDAASAWQLHPCQLACPNESHGAEQPCSGTDSGMDLPRAKPRPSQRQLRPGCGMLRYTRRRPCLLFQPGSA